MDGHKKTKRVKTVKAAPLEEENRASASYKSSRKDNETIFLTRFFTRPLAYPVARIAAWMGLSPNTVTLLGGSAWIASIPLFSYGGWLLRSGNIREGWACLLTAATLWPIGVIMDVADGSLARMTGKSSASGFYLDFVFHMIFSPMFLASIGISIHLVSGHVVFLILGLLSICANWGPSYAAKNHVVCDAVAKQRLQPETLSSRERTALFIDYFDAERHAVQRNSIFSKTKHLSQEVLFFPGQFTTFCIATYADFILWINGCTELICLKTLFLTVSILAIVRVPFRVRREFCSMREHDNLFKSTHANS